MKKVCLFSLTILLMGGVFAMNYTYDVGKDNVFVNVRLDHGGYVHLPFKFDALSVEGEHLLQGTEIYLFSSGELNYTTEELLEKTKDKYFFVLNDEYLVNSSVKVILPEGAILPEKYFIHPEGYSLSTNGRNIILSWDKMGSKEILIPYTEKSSKFYLWLIPLPFLLGAFIWFIYSRKEKKDFSKNLFREEKEIVNYLLKKKDNSCWTKEISKDLGIPKVRLSRKLRNLVEKEIIIKETHGNENKITLRK